MDRIFNSIVFLFFAALVYSDEGATWKLGLLLGMGVTSIVDGLMDIAKIKLDAAKAKLREEDEAS